MFRTVTPLPSPVVRLDYPLLSRQKLGLLTMQLGALLLAAACGFWTGRWQGPVAGSPPPEGAAATPNRPVWPFSGETPRPTVPAGNSHIGQMLISHASPPTGDKPAAGPRIVDFQTRLPAPRSGQLNYVLAAESDGTPYQGQLSLSIAGLRNGQLEVLQAPGPEVSVSGPQRLQLSFSRYVRTEGSVLLPPGFTPLFVGASLPSRGAGELRKLACPA